MITLTIIWMIVLLKLWKLKNWGEGLVFLFPPSRYYFHLVDPNWFPIDYSKDFVVIGFCFCHIVLLNYIFLQNLQFAISYKSTIKIRGKNQIDKFISRSNFAKTSFPLPLTLQKTFVHIFSQIKAL